MQQERAIDAVGAVDADEKLPQDTGVVRTCWNVLMYLWGECENVDEKQKTNWKGERGFLNGVLMEVCGGGDGVGWGMMEEGEAQMFGTLSYISTALTAKDQ